jgi:hypothetical protein
MASIRHDQIEALSPENRVMERSRRGPNNVGFLSIQNHQSKIYNQGDLPIGLCEYIGGDSL